MAEVERNFDSAANLTAVKIPGHEQSVINRLRATHLISRGTIPREVHKEEHNL